MKGVFGYKEEKNKGKRKNVIVKSGIICKGHHMTCPYRHRGEAGV
jgi:hypothetical protein